MELRKLQSSDMFKMLNIINKIGVGEFKKCFENENVQKLLSGKKVSIESVGSVIAFEIVGIVIPNLLKCEDDIYNFLSELSGMKVENLKTLDMLTFTEIIVDFIQKEEFKGFIKVVSKLIK